MELILDLCNQHHGDLNELKRMTINAFSAGADVVKVQLMDSENYLGTKYKKYRDISEEHFFEWVEYCNNLGVEAMASVFDELRLDWVKSANLQRHKIASRLLIDKPGLCKKILDDDKPTIISTGKIEEQSFPYGFGGGRISYLFCVSEYPTMLYNSKLRRMPTVFNSQNYIGYSDHTIGMAAVLEAFRRGASIVEKHFSNNPLAQGEHEGAHLCSFDKKMLSQFKSLTRQLAVLNGGKNVA